MCVCDREVDVPRVCVLLCHVQRRALKRKTWLVGGSYHQKPTVCVTVYYDHSVVSGVTEGAGIHPGQVARPSQNTHQ